MTSMTEFTADEEKAISQKPTLWHMVGIFFADVGIVCLMLKWPSDHPLVMGAITLATAYCMLCFTSCLHETVHQTLLKSKWCNVWLGRLIGMLIFVPYTVYRETHIRHHAYLNMPTDWEQWPYASPDASLGFRRIFVWLDLFFGIVTTPIIYARIYFHRDSPIKSPEIRSSIRNEYLLIVSFWAMMFSVVAAYDLWWGFLRAWLIPTLIAGFLQTARKLTEHLGMASYDPLLGARTVIGHRWLTRLGSWLNFDIFVHGPHHRHPRLPHTALADKMQEYMARHPDKTYPVYTSYSRAIRDMLPYLIKNPGAGVNVGGAPPDRVGQNDVDNFVSDVAEEILDAPPAPQAARAAG